jgi:hypothetical protein
MKYSSRFFLYAPLALFLILAVGAGVTWWRAANALSAKLDALNGHAVAGMTLSFKTKSVSGFPFNLDAVLNDVTITVETPHGSSSWKAEKFALHALTYGREQIIFEAAGHQQANWIDLEGHAHSLPFETGQLHGSAILGEQGLSRVDIDCVGFGSPALTAARVQLHARVAPNGATIEIAAGADAVRLSPPLTGALGSDIKQVRLDSAFLPAKPFEALRAGRGGWTAALEDWRRGGGHFDIASLQIEWTGVSAMGKGSLTLDDKRFVTGLIDFKIAGIERLIDRARRTGMNGDSFRGFVAALLQRAAKGGTNDAGQLGAVVMFNAGIVSIGDVPATTEEPLY